MTMMDNQSTIVVEALPGFDLMLSNLDREKDVLVGLRINSTAEGLTPFKVPAGKEGRLGIQAEPDAATHIVLLVPPNSSIGVRLIPHDQAS